MTDERQVSVQRVEPGLPSPWLVDHGGPARIANVDLRRFWVTLYKRRWLIAAATLVVVLVTGLLERSAPMMYTASAKIRIDPVTPALGSLSDIASLMVDSSYYQTEYVILQGAALAERVIDSLRLYDDPRFTNPPEEVGVVADARAYATRAWRALKRRLSSLGLPIPAPAGSALQRPATIAASNRAETWVGTYLSGLTISPIENSRLVTITYSSTSPELSAAIADEHAKQFIRTSLEARDDLNSEAQKILEKRLDEVRKHSEESEAKLNEFRRQHRVLAVGGSEKENVALEQLSTLTTDYAKAQSERIAAESDYTLVKKRRYDQLASVQRDPTYNALKDQLEQLRGDYDRQLQIYKPTYPKMVELSGQISRLEARVGEQIHKSVAGVESQYLAAKEKEDALAAEIEKQRKAVLDVNDLGVEYQVFYREAEANRELYKNLVTRASEAAIAGTIETTNIRIVEHAALPRSPSLLGVRRNLSRALFLGLLFGIALAFGLEYLDSAVKNPDDAEALLRLPTLAVVPSFSYRDLSMKAESGSAWRRWLAPPKMARRRRKHKHVIVLGRDEQVGRAGAGRRARRRGARSDASRHHRGRAPPLGHGRGVSHAAHRDAAEQRGQSAAPHPGHLVEQPRGQDRDEHQHRLHARSVRRARAAPRRGPSPASLPPRGRRGARPRPGRLSRRAFAARAVRAPAGARRQRLACGAGRRSRRRQRSRQWRRQGQPVSRRPSRSAFIGNARAQSRPSFSGASG